MGCASSAAVTSTPVTPVTTSREIRDEPVDFHFKYALGDKIGKGAYAQVHLARERKSAAKGFVAVKIRNLHSAQSPLSLDKKVCVSAYKEICLWSRVGNHRNCVNMQEHFFDDHLCYMVMEKCSRGLIAHLKSMSGFSEASLADIFTQMLQGIAHLHSANLVHRDVKPDNFLVGGQDHQTVKLGDFGLSAYVPEGGKAAGVCGTAPYMCPEMLQHGEADQKADLWSLGVVAYLLMCGSFPYTCRDGTAKSMKLAIACGSPVMCKSPWLTPSANSFLATLLIRGPEARSSAQSALSMPFLTSSCRSNKSLRHFLLAASKTGAFDAPDLDEISTVDGLLFNLKKGRAERTSKSLTERQIGAFIGATPKEIDMAVDSFLLPGSIDSKCREDTESSKSTTCPSSFTASASSGTSSR